MKWRTQIVREDAGDSTVLMVPIRPDTFYAKYFHCPTCSTSYTAPDPHDAFPVCSFCGQMVDLTEFLQTQPGGKDGKEVLAK